jgi:hypothetical protein
MNRAKRRKYFPLLEKKCEILSNHQLAPGTDHCACEWVKMEHEQLSDKTIETWAILK